MSGEPFQPNIIDLGKDRSLKGASLEHPPALPANIRLSWKGLPETTTLAYYQNPKITAVKDFIVQ
jgi:hypothetical protein